MKKYSYFAVTAFLSFSIFAGFAADGKTTQKAALQTTPQKVKQIPIRVCVLDFTSVNKKVKQGLQSGRKNTISIPEQVTLNDKDRKSINSVMQGFVRMIDAWDNHRTGTGKRIQQANDNTFHNVVDLAYYKKLAEGSERPSVIGAEYLAGYLGNYSDLFQITDTAVMQAAMVKVRNSPDFPKDFMLKLARNTGATHLIYGTVSDISASEKIFKGYGIETKSKVYQLDVILKLVDLSTQSTVYSKIYTGTYKEQLTGSSIQINRNIYLSLMKSALEEAAEDLYTHGKSGDFFK